MSAWWRQWPDANIAIVCGEVSGVMVLDCDTQEAVEQVEKFLPDALGVPTVLTPKGGRHYYFKFKPGLTNKVRVLAGMEMRTEGGYVLAPPSMNAKGAYRWL